MFSKKIRIYYIFINPKSQDILKDIRLTPRKFFFSAFIFGVFWVLYNKLWQAAIILIGLLYVLLKVLYFGIIDPVTYQVIYFSILIYLGFDASNLQYSKLEKQGFVLKQIMLATSPEKAEMKFCESYLNS